MLRARILFVPLIALVAITSCKSGGPEPVAIAVEKDTCSECKSVIRDLRFAGQYAAADEQVKKFDDPGCLMRALRRETASPAGIYFHSYSGEAWIAANDTWLGTASSLQTPRRHGWAAFADFGAAQEFVTGAGNGQILSFDSAKERIALADPLPEFHVVKGAEIAPTPAPAPVPVLDLYHVECAGCHGDKGDGKGQADPELLPQPRDFTRGKFKIRWTDTNNPITRAELLDILISGVPGTAMPSYKFLLPEQRNALATHVLALANLQDGSAAKPIEIPEPPAFTSELVEEGMRLYTTLGCAACHGESGKGDGPASPALRDDWGHPDPARDLSRDLFRGGNDPKSVFVRITIGMPGTAMPGYAEAADVGQRWAVVAYLASLWKPQRPPGDMTELGRQLTHTRACVACHQIEGKGGKVGPDLDEIVPKRSLDELKDFILHPRPEPKRYPDLPSRMPQLTITAPEADLIARYLKATEPSNPRTSNP